MWLITVTCLAVTLRSVASFINNYVQKQFSSPPFTIILYSSINNKVVNLKIGGYYTEVTVQRLLYRQVLMDFDQ